MNAKKLVIDYLISNGNKLPENETWYEVGIKFGVQSPKPKKAKEDIRYKKKSIARQTQRYWQSYSKQCDNMQLVKQTYTNGKLASETFKNQPHQEIEVDYTQFEIEKLTTNPNGVPWLKMRKKENFHSEEHLANLKEILTKEIIPLEYEFNETCTDKGLFIYGADKHIGALTKEDSIYTNKYGKEEIKKRLIEFTIKEIEEWIGIFGKPESLFIMDFGDALDGFNQKTTGGLRGTSSHILPQQLNNREQHDFYVEVHRELFEIIVSKKYAKDIYFIATSNSNHGGDFEYGAMRHLEDWLEIKFPFIKTKVNYLPFNHFFYGNHCIIFGHGKDEEDMKNGLPLNLNEKVENYLNNYIDKNELNKKYVTVITADLHQSSENYGKKLRYKKVLSQYGSSKWMHTNFGSGSPGLSSEMYLKNRNKIFKTDEFFEIENESNTGIDF